MTLAVPSPREDTWQSVEVQFEDAVCIDGIKKADFVEDQPVDVIFAQAPLFSTNKRIGKLLGVVNMFHSSVILAQGAGFARQYWTLEFDFTGGSFLDGIVPIMTPNASAPAGVSLSWNNDARWCLESGMKWGRDHWSKRYDLVTTVSPDQARRAFTDFMGTWNTTVHGEHPQYQLWRVAQLDVWGRTEKRFVQDVTCNDGAVWFLEHLVSSQGAALQSDFLFQGTAVILKAHRIVPVNMSDPAQVRPMVHFFRKLKDMVSVKTSVLQRLVDVAELVLERKYVFDSNAQVYYEVHGSSLPWIEFHYAEFPLRGPPWKPPIAEKAAAFEIV